MRTKDAIDNELRTIDRFDKLFGHMRQDAMTQLMLYQYIDRRMDERAELKGKKNPRRRPPGTTCGFLKKVFVKGIKWGAGTNNPVVDLEFDTGPFRLT